MKVKNDLFQYFQILITWFTWVKIRTADIAILDLESVWQSSISTIKYTSSYIEMELY